MLITFLVFTLFACNNESKDTSSPKDDSPMSGIIVENDNKTRIAREFMRAYVNKDMSGVSNYFSEDAIVYVNDAKMTASEMMTGFLSGHDYYNNINHSNVYITTMYYNNGSVYTNTWYDWSGVSKKTGVELKIRGYGYWKWDGEKIVEMYNAFDPTEYNKAFIED